MDKGIVRKHLSAGMLARMALAIGVGSWLCWQISLDGIATLATRSTDARLLSAVGSFAHPQAGSTYAESLLTAKQPANAAEIARSVVLHDPTNDRALRVLGLASEQLGRQKQAEAIMSQAAALGWRDTPTQLWMLRYAALNDDFRTVIERTDALARRNRMGNITFPIFRAAVTEPRLRSALVASLTARPMWRGAFFADIRQNLPANATDGMEALFRELRANGQAVDPVEWLSYVDRLVDLGQYRRARDVWTKAFAIPESRLTALPYDGNFTLAASKPAGTPLSQFEWRLNPDLAGAVTFGRGSLEVPGQLTGGTSVISQLLILTPGTYSLSADVEGPATSAAAGWSIACLPSKLELSRRLSRGGEDELTDVAFDVPKSGCGAQLVTLVTRDRIDSEPVTISNVQIR